MVERELPPLDAVFHALGDPTRRRMLHELAGGERTVGQLAEQLGLTERTLSTLFRKHLGLTVSGFISEERIRVGCQMLGSTQMSVQDIALEVGFANTANFSTAFRERLGLTPQAWRQLQRGGGAS